MPFDALKTMYDASVIDVEVYCLGRGQVEVFVECGGHCADHYATE